MLYWLSGEFVLRTRPNGGAVVFTRAMLVTVQVFALALLLQSALDPAAAWWTFSPAEARRLAADRVPWLGAIFGAVYAFLYSRFTGQWTYLAGLFNQLMAMENTCPRDAMDPSGPFREKRMVWWLGFIEDAIDLHLALKPTYAEAIASLADEPEVIEVMNDPSNRCGRDLKRLLPRIKDAAHLAPSAAPQLVPVADAAGGDLTMVPRLK